MCIHKAICKCIYLCHCVTGLLFYDSHSTIKTHLLLLYIYIYKHVFMYNTYVCAVLFYGFFQIPIAFSGHGSHTLNMGVYTSTIQ